uniref:Pyridine nucleotide-disulphide oxidoreductase dimerisation domain-containing protein n=1 Tax=Strombidium inclinatum TaxID=197538 RepID=A0A7S3IFD6_9SPIT|mmetsp:Transcript_1398/g.1868  ORF Transcript_1398/g.1868 Transcript_1398/m.1868 type:complete len:211 (+) Transcript_1398:1057-1689(+)
MGLTKIGVDLAPSKKVQGRQEEPERTNIDHIYAVGDVLEGAPELMPVALKAGKHLATRIHDRMIGEKSEEDILKNSKMNYDLIPSTVFTPTEYSFVGMTEGEAIAKFGEDDIEVYHRQITPLQFSIVQDSLKYAYMKVVCQISAEEKVLGIHYFGPGADEVIGGYGVAMKLGLQKKHLDDSIGIHPSTSEDLFNLDVTKRSGDNYAKTEC